MGKDEAPLFESFSTTGNRSSVAGKVEVERLTVTGELNRFLIPEWNKLDIIF